MYAGPIVKTYYSVDQYQRDTALMAYYGYQAMNVQQRSVTNGLTLTLLLIFGLLLTPFCIGVVILCFLPFAFSKEYDVSYIQQRALFGPGPQQYMAPSPYAQPQMLPPTYSQPLRPPPQSQPSYAPSYTPSQPITHDIVSAAPPRSGVSFQTRVREGFASAVEVFYSWPTWQQVLAATVAILVIAGGVLLLVFVASAILIPR